MPSWSDSLQRDHQRTRRQLIGVGDTTGDDSESDGPTPSGQVQPSCRESRPNVRRQMLLANDASSDEMQDADEEEDENDVDLRSAADLSLASSQWQPFPSHNLIAKRTLLTAEEMEDSGDEFQEQEEEVSIESQLGEQSTAMRHLAITLPTSDAMASGGATVQASDPDDIDHQENIDIEMQSAQSLPKASDLVQEHPARSTSSPAAIDSGRAQEFQESAEPPTKRTDALKRK